ncbi:hypothetical protein LCGC14_2595600, partial [marine sediment metagenome]
DEICKSCTYDLEAVVGFLEYHGWTILPPGEIVEIAKAVEDRVIRDGMQSGLTPPPPKDNGPHQTLTEAALEGSGYRLPPLPEKQPKGPKKP